MLEKVFKLIVQIGKFLSEVKFFFVFGAIYYTYMLSVDTRCCTPRVFRECRVILMKQNFQYVQAEINIWS